MTRRKFGASAGMLGLAMMVKPEWIHAAYRGKVSGRPADHIQNRRLFSFAAGTITLATWEREHLHGCDVCQEMICVLVRQTSPARI